jgi:shikimate 5-dehydrogenase
MRLSDFTANGYSIVVNATPVGRDDGEMPFGIEDLSRDAVVVDLTYGATTTPLVARASASGRTAIDGKEVLLIQAQRQFRLMTNQEMPEGLARRTLGWTPDETLDRRLADEHDGLGTRIE